MIYTNLKLARNKSELKQDEVARRIGCSSTSITHWEVGRIEPPLEKLEKVCRVYGIHPSELLDRAYGLNDLIQIASKPVSERSYEENVALTFCGKLLSQSAERLNPDAAQDCDILTAFHSLKPEAQMAFWDMCIGLISRKDNVAEDAEETEALVERMRKTRM